MNDQAEKNPNICLYIYTFINKTETHIWETTYMDRDVTWTINIKL